MMSAAAPTARTAAAPPVTIVLHSQKTPSAAAAQNSANGQPPNMTTPMASAAMTMPDAIRLPSSLVGSKFLGAGTVSRPGAGLETAESALTPSVFRDCFASAIIERNNQQETVVVSGQFLGLPQQASNFRLKTLALANDAHAHIVFMKLRKVVADETAQQAHQIADFGGRSRPVLGAERIDGQNLDAQFADRPHGATQGFDATAVALAARQAALGSPPAVAVHDEGHVARRLEAGIRHFRRSRSLRHHLLRCRGPDSNRHDFFFFGGKDLIDFTDDLIRRLLDLAGHAGVVIFADFAVFFELLEEIERIATYMADCDPRGLGVFVGDFDHLLAALLIEFRDAQPQHLPFRGRGQSEIGIYDCLLDRMHHGLVPNLHAEEPGLRHADGGELVERHVGAVGIDLHWIEHARGSAAGTQSA